MSRRLTTGVLQQAVNATGPTIYGLQFDGVDDYLRLTYADIKGKTISITLQYTSGEGQFFSYRWSVSTNSNNRIGGTFNSSNSGSAKVAIGQATGTSNTVSYDSALTVNQLVTAVFDIESLGSIETGTLNGNSMDNPADAKSRVDTSSVQHIQFGTRYDGNWPYAGVITEIDIDGTTYNHANSWGGETISGAIAVKSSDNGNTWQPI